MKNRFILLVGIFFSSIHLLYSQRTIPTPELSSLDNSFFKWKDFSFNKPWEKVKDKCGIEKIEAYTNDCQTHFCGNISDTTKSYLLQSRDYHEFNDIWFDQVILHLIGSTTSRFNYSSLYFTKQFNDSIKANLAYKEILKLFKTKYGDNYTGHFERYKKEIADSMTENTLYACLNENNPCSAVDETEWNCNRDIHLKLSFIQESNLIILSVSEYPSKSFYPNARNWFKESEYDEKFTAAFKEFDAKNGYKGLKFGMLKSATKNIVKYRAPDILKQYSVASIEYKNWFYIPFDYCYLMFNKKNQLYNVSLSKDEYSNADYEQFLKELIELFGNPTTYKDKSGESEFTLWKGKNLNFLIMRPKDKSIYVDFSCVALDDTSPTDKLY